MQITIKHPYVFPPSYPLKKRSHRQLQNSYVQKPKRYKDELRKNRKYEENCFLLFQKAEKDGL